MTNLMTASRQWASRPSDERFTSLTDLHDHTTSQRCRSAGKVVSSRGLTALADAKDAEYKGLLIQGPGGNAIAPTHMAFGQLANLAGAPAGYLRNLPARRQPPSGSSGKTIASRSNAPQESCLTWWPNKTKGPGSDPKPFSRPAERRPRGNAHNLKDTSMRKIVQISAVPETENNNERLYALCDDGSVWVTYTPSGVSVWIRVGDVPQEAPAFDPSSRPYGSRT